MKKSAALSLLLFAWPFASPASDLTGMYDEDFLRYWQPRYHRNIVENLEEVVWPVLTAEERARLADVAVDVPLAVDGDPFAFHAAGDPARVVLPALSVNFFADICASFAWLDLNGYESAVVIDYLSMLKYRSAGVFPGGRYPAPFAALGIPEDAWDDPQVGQSAQTCLGTGIVFILAHELGHIYHDHRGYIGVSTEQAQWNEAQADAFALRVLQRIGDMPTGMTFWFLSLTYWAPNRGDFQSDAAWQTYLRDENTHPLTGSRLRAIASGMRDGAADFAQSAPDYGSALQASRYMADQIDTIAGFLDDPDLQRVVAARGRAMDLEELQPVRKAAAASVQDPEAALSATARQAFDGMHAGTYSHPLQSGGSEELPATFALQRSGDQVYGRLNFGLGIQEVDGQIEGNQLYFEWRWLDLWGMGVLEASPTGNHLSGTWGFEDSAEGGGRLEMLRQ